MRRSAVVLLLALLLATSLRAQVVESATRQRFALTVGGIGSAFDPNDSNNAFYAVGGTNFLFGLGTYVDVRFSHWVQVEGEARWLRFNELAGEHQDHYLIGPKIPIHQFGRADAYGKVLIGLAKMTFPYGYGYGSFTALAYGGGIDFKLSRKFTLRAADFEFQQWPKWLGDSALYPYGVSAGMGYRIF